MIWLNYINTYYRNFCCSNFLSLKCSVIFLYVTNPAGWFLSLLFFIVFFLNVGTSQRCSFYLITSIIIAYNNSFSIKQVHVFPLEVLLLHNIQPRSKFHQWRQYLSPVPGALQSPIDHLSVLKWSCKVKKKVPSRSLPLSRSWLSATRTRATSRARIHPSIFH